jgi:hypothetical protein
MALMPIEFFATYFTMQHFYGVVMFVLKNTYSRTEDVAFLSYPLTAPSTGFLRYNLCFACTLPRAKLIKVVCAMTEFLATPNTNRFYRFSFLHITTLTYWRPHCNAFLWFSTLFFESPKNRSILFPFIAPPLSSTGTGFPSLYPGMLIIVPKGMFLGAATNLSPA